MARDSVTVDFLLETKDAERDLARIRKEMQRLGVASGKALKGFGGTGGEKVRALGSGLSKATVRADEFTKSLEASNARVVAFGASAGIIMQIDRAFKGLVSSTVKVEKALLDVNVVLNASQKNLKKFATGMFQVGKQTAQSFDVVSEAATELARQGLGMEKTLARTKDALILTRLTGMDAADAVKSLTAAVNSFNKEGVTSAQVINRMAKVDAAFAVSSDDLAKSISRVGASAVSAGVSMNELLAITTAVQERTARGGAVIGNAFKTIFTRLQRKDVLQNLVNLGIAVKDFNGNALSGIQVLQNLADRFGTLSKATQSSTAEQVAGVFQVNILKAAMSDLSSVTSNYGRALRTANSATNEAYKRNEQLNQSLDALLNRTMTNLTQAGASIGGSAIEPAIRKTLGVVNGVLESFGDGGSLQNFGKTWGKGIMQGLGDFISGPGLVVITATIGKLFFNLTKFTGKAFADIMNINKASQQRAGIEGAIVETLSKEPAILQSVLSKNTSLLTLEKQILNTIKLQNLERAAMTRIASPIASSIMAKGGRVGRSGGLYMGSSGFVPNFASAGAERAGAAAGGYKAGAIKTMTQPGGSRIMYNSAETVKRFPGMSQSAIMPPKSSSAGSNYKSAFSAAHGFNPYAAKGFVPNFMAYYKIAGRQMTGAGVASGIKSGKITESQAAGAGYAKGQSKSRNVAKEFVYPAGQLGMLGIEGAHSGSTSTSFGQLAQFKSAPAWAKKQKVRFQGVQTKTINQVKKNLSVQSFSNDISRIMTDPVARLSTQIFGGALGNDWASSISKVKNQFGGKRQLLPPGAEGSIFEAAINLGLKATKGGATLAKTFDQSATGSQRPFDFEETGMARPAFKKAFGFGANLKFADAKRTLNNDSVQSVIKKAYNAKLPGLPQPNNAALGFVPNFNPVASAVGRELAGGVPSSAIRLGSASSLRSPSNPGGLGVYNTIHEPGGLSQGISRARSRGINPKSHGVPNFFEMSTGQGAQPTGDVDTSRFNKFNDGLRDSADAAKEATSQTRRMGAAMGGMMVQMAAGAAAGQMQQGSLEQTLTRGTGSIAGFAGMGMMMGGPKGAIVGGLIGGVGMGLDLLATQTAEAENSFEHLSAILEETRRRGAEVAEALTKVEIGLTGLGSEADPEKRLKIGRDIVTNISKATEKLGDSPEGAEAARMQEKLRNEGQFMSTTEIQNLGKRVSMLQAKRERRENLDASASQIFNNRDLGAFAESAQEKRQGNYGRMIGAAPGMDYVNQILGNPLMILPKLAAGAMEGAIDDPKKRDAVMSMMNSQMEKMTSAITFGNFAFGMPDSFSTGAEASRSQRSRARAVEGIDPFMQEFLGSPKLDGSGTIQDAIINSKEALATLASLEEGININNKGGLERIVNERGGDLLFSALSKALSEAKIDDGMAELLKQKLNTPEAREAFILRFFGRGVEGVGQKKGSILGMTFGEGGYLTQDTKALPPKSSAFTKSAQIENEKLVQSLVNRGVDPLAAAPADQTKKFSDFAENMRVASRVAKEASASTLRRIAQEKRLSGIQDAYAVAVAKATEDTLGSADKQLELELAAAARDFKAAGEAAEKGFNADTAKTMEEAAKALKKFVVEFAGQPILKDGKIVPDSSAETVIKGIFDKLSKMTPDELRGEIDRTSIISKDVMSVQDQTIEKFAEIFFKGLTAATDKQEASTNAATDAQNNAKATATEVNKVRKNQLTIDREYNKNRINELAVTKAIVAVKQKQHYEELYEQGKMSAADVLSQRDQTQMDQMRIKGISRENVGGAFASGFTGGMTYDDFALFGDLKEGGEEVAGSMKTSFADAFKSIASGATDARSAIVQFADSILNTISDVTARIGTNMLFSGMGFDTKSQGGLVKGYNRGGIVSGGSGYKDDVPAMMNGGEFVIKKSSAQKIGYGALNAINSGGAPGYNAGGMFALSAGASMLSGAINSGGQSTPSATRGQDYGQGRGAYGYFGGADINATGPSSMSGGSQSAAISLSKGFNFYRRDPATGRLISERSRPTEGGFDVSSALSLQGRLNEGDPQTARMFGREKSMGDYGNYLNTETARRKEVVRAHEAKKRGRLVSAYANAAMLIGGSYMMSKTLPSQATRDAAFAAEGVTRESAGMGPGRRIVPNVTERRGPVGYASGGSTQASPALLTGGEYVMNPDTVRTHGLGFMNELNRGNVPGYAGGGYVGGAGGSSSNVNISVNVDRRGNPSVESSANNEGKENDQQEMQKNKQFGAALQTVVLQEIMKQQRPGGLLQKTN